MRRIVLVFVAQNSASPSCRGKGPSVPSSSCLEQPDGALCGNTYYEDEKLRVCSNPQNWKSPPHFSLIFSLTSQ